MPSQRRADIRRLKAQALKAAVLDNTDDIAGRLPAPLRPGRRLLNVLVRRTWLLAVPIGVFLASESVADRPLVDPVEAHVALREPSAEASAVEPAVALDRVVASRPVVPGVLALGVRRVVLDAGHGGIHTGAKSTSGLMEKDITLDLAGRVRRLLTARGIDVVMTRSGDETLSLKDRASTANEGRGDIFVSIHVNVLMPATARGIETYYLGPGDQSGTDAVATAENQHSGYSLADMRTLLDRIYADARRDESARLAHAVQRALVQRLQAVDPSITDRGVKTAPFIVLVATDMPAILAEVSCLSNDEEAERLGTPTYRQTIAESLTAGIQAFMDDRNRDL